MKTNKIVLTLLIAVLVSSVSCTRNIYVTKRVPPGHAKKMTGSKSAKPYAPGQQKKHH